MSNPIVNKILEKMGQKDLLDDLAHKITLSELNSLLLEVYQIKTREISPTELLNLYTANRFVKPASTNPQELLQLEMDFYRIAESFSFTPIDLSPVAPLGACSVIAPVNQNNVMSALRGTEVVADATNSLALHICSLKKNRNLKSDNFHENLKYCNAHRHIRTQKFDVPGFRPHFKIFSMLTSGRDVGSYNFEMNSILEHITVYKEILKQLFHIEDLKVKLIESSGYDGAEDLALLLRDHIKENISNINVYAENQAVKNKNQYYKGIQFKLSANISDCEYEIVDGGFVDWSQKLLSNKKERMLTSGLGVDFLLNIMNESF